MTIKERLQWVVAEIPIVPRPPVFHTQLVWPADRPEKAAAKALREAFIQAADRSTSKAAGRPRSPATAE